MRYRDETLQRAFFTSCFSRALEALGYVTGPGGSTGRRASPSRRPPCGSMRTRSFSSSGAASLALRRRVPPRRRGQASWRRRLRAPQALRDPLRAPAAQAVRPVKYRLAAGSQVRRVRSAEPSGPRRSCRGCCSTSTPSSPYCPSRDGLAALPARMPPSRLSSAPVV